MPWWEDCALVWGPGVEFKNQVLGIGVKKRGTWRGKVRIHAPRTGIMPAMLHLVAPSGGRSAQALLTSVIQVLRRA